LLINFNGEFFLAAKCFDFLKNFQKGGPPVNSEFYPGWLAHWQEPYPKVNSDDVVNQMKSMLSLNASFSFYMFHGGTNFGFTSGANIFESDTNIGYLPQLTSYDYDAPIAEAGDLTEKYFKIKQTLENAVSLLTFHSPMRKSKISDIFFLETFRSGTREYQHYIADSNA